VDEEAKLTFVNNGIGQSHERNVLFVVYSPTETERIPSGRILCYPYAKLEPEGVSYAKAAWKPAQDAKEWPRARLWKGLACENVTQAVANDLLRHALRQLDDVVLHVHDEIVLETADPEAAENLKNVMCTAPAWADGLPLNAEVETMKRYGK
jgi:DNA polymerase